MDGALDGTPSAQISSGISAIPITVWPNIFRISTISLTIASGARATGRWRCHFFSGGRRLQQNLEKTSKAHVKLQSQHRWYRLEPDKLTNTSRYSLKPQLDAEIPKVLHQYL